MQSNKKAIGLRLVFVRVNKLLLLSTRPVLSLSLLLSASVRLHSPVVFRSNQFQYMPILIQL